MNRLLIYIFITSFYSNFTYSQPLKSSALIDYKKSSYYKTNYNGPIKSSYWYYTYVTDSLMLGIIHDDILRKRVKEDIMIHNRDVLGGVVYREFNKNGFITKVINNNLDFPNYMKGVLDTVVSKTIYKYDEFNWQFKKQFKIFNRQKYPVYDYAILVKPNFTAELSYSNEPISYENNYILDELGRINQSQNYDDNNPPFTEINYNYDDFNNIIRLNIKTKQKNPIPFHFLDTETGFCPDLHILYEYDKKNRITQLTYIGCNDTLAFEKYEYDSFKDFVTKRTRYIKSSMRGVTHVTNTMVFQYNENGDVIYKEYIKKRPDQRIFLGAYLEATQPIYYKYEYDKYNNWVKCYIYMEGKPEDSKPTLIAERELMYYES